MKTIGTDLSLDVCKAEGYMMMQYDARKKFNKDEYYRLFNYYPEYCEDVAGTMLTDTMQNWSNLVEIYEQHKEGINSFAETDQHVNFNDPDYYDFLTLADEINAYCGL